MSNVDINTNAEPRTIFLGFLIRTIEKAYEEIYLSTLLTANSHRILRGIIKSLDPASKKHLQSVWDELCAYEKGKKGYCRADIEAAYDEIIGYLQTSYLREVSLGIIPTSLLKATSKKPEDKAYPESLSAKV